MTLQAVMTSENVIALLEGLKMEKKTDNRYHDFLISGYNTAVDDFNAKIDAAISQVKGSYE